MDARYRRILWGAAIISVGAAIIFGRHSNDTQGRDAIVIGVLAPKTSFMSGHGHSIEIGARLAAQELNARGGINGKPVRLVVLDTASDPAIAAERAKELIERHGAKLLIGTGTSAETLAAIGPTTKAKVPFIYSLDGECKTCASGSPDDVSHYVYGSGFTERMVVEPFLRYLAEQYAPKNEPFRLYLIGGDYVYPRTTNTYARLVAERLGYEIVGEEYSDTNTRDYTPVIRRILQSKPTLLIVTNPGASGVTFMRQAQQLGLHKEVVISGFATFDQEAIDAMGNASEGVLAVNRYSMELKNPENGAFIKEFRRLYANERLLPGPTAAAGAYGSIMVAAKAFEKAHSIASDQFYLAMKGLEIDLPQGRVRVNPINNIFDQHLYVLRIRNQHYEIVADLGIQSHPELEGCSVK